MMKAFSLQVNMDRKTNKADVIEGEKTQDRLPKKKETRL